MESIIMQISEKQLELEEINNKIEFFEPDPDEHIDQYEEFLNGAGDVEIFGCTFFPADILRELDYTAYRQGLLEYVDALKIEDNLPEVDELRDRQGDLEVEIEELKEALEEETGMEVWRNVENA